ncbi:tyrosine-type recombinase/integrase [Brenneria corticis]|uniref:tyrosine-type recombinase/integrase n=1 Tax=Brenneria corticis TaxID=2173106 RepID=UPI001FED98EB|nr:tyrosine-type recombinase/integrase [Brenneria sp. CFCC 11842]
MRLSEVAGTLWCEIDIKKRLWTLPGARMKMKREHLVPLSPQVLAELEQLKPLSEHSPFVFPGRVKRSQPMHSETVNEALWRMGYGGEVSHGFRALGSK